MFKKLLAILLACLLMIPCGLALAEDAEALTSGDFEYTLNADGSVTITEYSGEAESLTIPAELDGHPVTAIGDIAFFRCEALTGVTIPDSVTSIGANPFAYCEQLTQISVSANHPTLATIDGVLFDKTTRTLLCYPCTLTAESYAVPEGIQAIGGEAFSGCEALRSITLPDTLTSIGVNPFELCGQLTQIDVSPDNPALATIDGVLFDKTTRTLLCYPCAFTEESYAVPEGIQAIAAYAFSNCVSLTSVTLPGSLTSIGETAFFRCESLASVTIPGSVASIGRNAFVGCTSLTSATIQDGVTAIGDNMFSHCDALTDLIIPASVTSIGEWAFYYCESLTSITLPDSVTSIGNSAFSSCKSLTGITLPDSLSSIGDKAFLWCESLTSLALPDSVASIGADAFVKCPNLTLTVSRDSYAAEYAKAAGIPYAYPDSMDWLNG